MHPKVTRADFEAGFALLNTLTSPSRERFAGFQTYPVGRWSGEHGVIHAVNAMSVYPDIDLGLETACETVSWNPDNPRDYPIFTDKFVDCMTCLVRLTKS